MKKWIVWGLSALYSTSSFMANAFDENISSRQNPTTMAYYVEHYKNTSNPEFQNLLISVRAAADTINFYTRRLDARNQRIDYCLPMRDPANRENLSHWKTKDLMALINNHIEHDPSYKKYGKHGIGGPIGSYLVVALKAQYPCPPQKQL